MDNILIGKKENGKKIYAKTTNKKNFNIFLKGVAGKGKTIFNTKDNN